MRSILYIITVILVTCWLIGFVGYHAGGLINTLLIIAVMTLLLNIIEGRKELS